MKQLLKQLKNFRSTRALYDTARSVFFSMLSIAYRLCAITQHATTKTAVVVLYHRVDKLEKDPTMLAVTPERFEEHLRFFLENYEVISLKEVVSRMDAKTISGKEVAITFDDGYKDNLTNALPLLEKYQVPATIFVTTGQLGQTASFPWDLNYTKTDRAQFLTGDEIRTLAIHPLITIGAHTVNHPHLASLNREDAREEIIKSKQMLESITNDQVDFFAFPFGGPLDFTRENAIDALSAGYTAAFANDQLFVTNNSSLGAIPRMNIRDVSSETLRVQLRTR